MLTLGGDLRRDNFSKVKGLKRGIVKDVEDPDKLNRVKVTLIDEELETPFADVLAGFAGEKYGMTIIPRVGEEVILGFLDGQINYPIILGCVNNAKNKPPVEVDKKNEIMLMILPGGLKIEIDNKEDNQKITTTTKKGHQIILDDGSNETLEFKEKDGKTSIGIDFKKGEIAIKADSKITFTAGTDSLVLEKSKGLKLSSSGGDLAVDVNNVKLQAKANFECKANAQVKAAGTAGVEIKSDAIMTIKGTMTKIN